MDADGGKGPRSLACPFYKREPAVYHECGRAELLSVEDVFEHLQNHHAAPIHCVRCYAEFSSNDGRERHYRDGCVVEDRRKIDGYCETTRIELVELQVDLCILDDMDEIQGDVDEIQDDRDEKQDDRDEKQDDRDKEVRARWEIIFSILFPGEAQPRSPFVDSECNGNVSAVSSCTTELTLVESIGRLRLNSERVGRSV